MSAFCDTDCADYLVHEFDTFTTVLSVVFTKTDLSIYIRLDIGHQTKCSHIQHCDVSQTHAIFDDVKHFLCEVRTHIS